MGAQRGLHFLSEFSFVAIAADRIIGDESVP